MKNVKKAFEPIQTAMKITGGFTLSQLTDLSGLEATTIQNWVKRGWVEAPVNRRYGEASTARVLIINMLKGAMQLSDIASLLSYINGKADDRGDDAIPDGELYSLMCAVTEKLEEKCFLSNDEIANVIDDAIKDYDEPFEGGKEKLRNGLKVMMLAYISTKLRNEADELLKKYL